MRAILTRHFPDVPADHIEAAAPRFYTVEVGKGLMLMEEGEHDAAILFIVEGHVAIRTGEFEIATAGPGTAVGEIGLFKGAMRIATVQAVTPCVYVVLDRRDYDALLDQGNRVAYAVEKAALRQLVTRLRDVDARLANLGEGRTAGPDAKETDGTPRAARGDVLAWLQRSALFEDAPIGALDDVAARMEPRAFAAGEVLCKQGSAANDLYFLAEGAIDVTVELEPGRAERVAVLEPGDVFGVASMLQDRSRMASCVARGDVIALRMERKACQELVGAETRGGSVFRTAMIRALGDQIAYANAQFAHVSLARQKRTSELLARLGIEAHGRHIRDSR
jgi:CRP-like cAMP-binding protein